MDNKIDSDILREITDYYLGSRDFNGISCSELKTHWGISYKDLNEILIRLIEKDKIDLRFGDFHPNMFIRGMFEYPKDVLLQIISPKKIINSCIYPTKKHLTTKVNRKKYIGKPFTLKLALGANHLDFEAFDLTVIEMYRNDPRYLFANSDIMGHVYYTDKNKKRRNNPDNVFLQDYGYCFNKKQERAIAVFLTRLTTLSPEHQQIWNAKKLKGSYHLHPDFDRISKGHFPEGMSIFESFVYEQEKINKICTVINKPQLFKKIYLYDKPNEFTFLIRPTLKEYENFIHVFDKLVSENINLDFFKGEQNFEKEDIRKDKKIVVRRKNSLELLDEWFHLHYNHPDKNLIKKTLQPFRELRRLRQAPAHSISENEYDQKYYTDQKELMIKMHNSLIGVKCMLMVHPLISEEKRKSFEIKKPVWLQ